MIVLSLSTSSNRVSLKSVVLMDVNARVGELPLRAKLGEVSIRRLKSGFLLSELKLGKSILFNVVVDIHVLKHLVGNFNLGSSRSSLILDKICSLARKETLDSKVLTMTGYGKKNKVILLNDNY